MKIRTKFILANLFIVLFLLGTLTYVFLKRSTDLVFSNILENNVLSLSQTGSNLDNKLQSYEEIANTLFLNNKLDEAVTTTYPSDQEAYDVYFNYYQQFVSVVQTTKDIYHFYQYTDNPTFVFANIFLIDKDIRESDWYRKTIETRSGGYWTPAYVTPADKEPVVSFRKRLNNFDPDSPRVVSLEIKLKVLQGLISEESKSKRFLLLLSDGTVLLDSAQKGQYNSLDELPFRDQIAGRDSGSFRYSDDGAPYMILFRSLNSRNTVKGMKLISYVPLAEITPKLNQLKSLALLLFGLALVISVLLISAMSVGLTRRLSDLSIKMRRLNRDNFDSFIEVRGRDEVAQLGEMFNLMVRRLRELISEVYQSEIDRKENALRTKEVELYALQTQINPHFLFNTLNMIRGKLLIAGDRENAKVIGLLAKSFRMMLKKGGQTVRLSEEIEFIDSYLQIQRYRFGDKFSYAIDVGGREMDVFVPKLCIQPLVENAIAHGVELSPRESSIRVEGRQEGGLLRLGVVDDGTGIAPERLAEIRQWLTEGDSLAHDAHIGLRNVQRRLRSLYGEAAGLQVESELGKGTRVTMTIPVDGERGSAHV